MVGNNDQMATWDLMSPDEATRFAVADEAILRSLTLSETASNQIRELEESVVTAEQRLGMFLVG